MAVSLRKHLDCHAEIAGRFPHIGAGLHQPGRRCVAQRVRCHVDAESSIGHNVREGFVDALDRLAIPFDGKPLPASFPSPQMRQEVIGQWHGRLAFLRLRAAGRPAIEYAALKINPAVANNRLQSGTAHCTGPRAGVEHDQDKARDMLPGPPIGRLPFLHFPVSPCYSLANRHRWGRRTEPWRNCRNYASYDERTGVSRFCLRDYATTGRFRETR